MKMCTWGLIALLITGCCTLTAKKMTNVQLGMTKNEVIQILGEPLNISNDGNYEILNYTLVEDKWNCIEQPYAVYIKDSKVVKYGRAGHADAITQPLVIPTPMPMR
jgi:outer membrane protein assembly factor BamE (lipoprotein component of BamABCDE complex)